MVRFVVMASGQATRMGQDKLSLPWQDSTVLEYVLQVLDQALNLTPKDFTKSAEVWVIARKPIREYIKSENWIASAKMKSDNPVKHVWLNRPEPRPLSETIRLGIADLPEEMQGICFVPGDQVGLEPIQLAELISAFMENQPDFLVPWDVKNKRSGSPVFFHKRYYQELCSLQGEQGGRAVLNRYPERWVKYSVSPEFLEDMDTPEDYRRLRSSEMIK